MPGRPSSPLKSPKKRITISAILGEDGAINDHIHNAQMALSEKEIEIERLKITVVSLNTKCTVVDDHIEDVRTTTVRYEESEIARENLQIHIVESSKKIAVDNRSHTDYQQELNDEIEALRRLL
jgi:hypothetical protein